MAAILFESVAQLEAAERWGAHLGLVHVEGYALGGPQVVAFVNLGSWAARCPFCPSAREATPDRGFWCPECGNTAVGGQEVRIVWPSDEDMTLVDELLGVRPQMVREVDPKTGQASTFFPRGWNSLTEQLIGQVAVENLERGLPIPARIRRDVEAFLEADWERRGLLDEMRGYQAVS